jgi:tetratricopeptide (TPR) repeat protein
MNGDAPAEVRFGLLGPVLVSSAGSVAPVRAARQRTLLAALLLRANRVITADELADQVWDGAPPAGAAANWRAALGLWRGAALEDVPETYLKARELPVLTEGWVQVHEALARADLELGHPGEVMEQVVRLQAEFPYREGLSGLLMRAQVAAGRPVEALAEYTRLRRVLVSDLGVEPGPPIEALQAAILDGQPLPPWPTAGPPARLTAGAPARPAATPAGKLVPARPTPRQLPGAVRHFTGRSAELRALTELADLARTGQTVIAAISGMAGTGKTALAVHWAHQVAHRFPDGQLSVNLRGFHLSGTPMTPAEAIRACLDALGVTTAQLPVGIDAQVALYRSLLADRRMLVLLDNARDDEHARLLLPGTASCLAVVTSRTQLTGLAVAHGAHLLDLGLLTREDTRELLARHLGPTRMAAEPAAVDELITRSGGLALGASILAARAAASPGHALATLAAQLRDARGRLDAMETGDAAASLRTVFSWSGQHLSAPAMRAFRLLGLHPGPDISLPAAASLLGAPPRDARAAMTELARAHLLTEHIADRFTSHDLLLAYAAEQAETAESSTARRAATRRVLDHYLHAARNSARVLIRPPQTDQVRLEPLPPGVTAEEFACPDAELQWFKAEQPVLTAVIAWSAENGFDSCCWQLPWLLMASYDRGAHWLAMARAHQIALPATQRLNNRRAEGLARRALGYADGRMGNYEQAATHFQAAADILRSAGDDRDRAVSHRGLAWVLGLCGRHDDAMEHAQHALSLTRGAQSVSDHANALNMVGRCYAYLGAYQHAVVSCSRALVLHQHEANPMGQAEAWYSLGVAHQHAGRPDEGIAAYQQALDLFEQLGDRHYIGETLTGLADTHQALGHRATAVTLWQRALGIMADIRHPDTDMSARSYARQPRP